jgi:hypothetical protein
MKKIFHGFGVLALVLASGTASATDVGVTGDVGTTGVGLHFSVPVVQSVNARLGVNYLDYSYTGNTHNVNYEFKMKLNTFDALVDWFPFDNGFRVSGGLVYNDNQVTATGKPNSNGTYTLNGNTYQASSVGSLNGKVEFRKIAPYLGIGYGNALAKESAWHFSTDVGVLFQGSASTSLASSGCTTNAMACSQLATDVAAENAQLSDKVHNFKAYPVVRVGIGYRF